MQDFKNLKVWQGSHQLALQAYQVTRNFPREEMFGLVSQMRRAAQSISANIAEGSCRQGDAEFSRFLYIAMGSASELECHLLLARDLGYIDSLLFTKLEKQITSVKRMINGLIRKLRTTGPIADNSKPIASP